MKEIKFTIEVNIKTDIDEVFNNSKSLEVNISPLQNLIKDVLENVNIDNIAKPKKRKEKKVEEVQEKKE